MNCSQNRSRLLWIGAGCLLAATPAAWSNETISQALEQGSSIVSGKSNPDAAPIPEPSAAADKTPGKSSGYVLRADIEDMFKDRDKENAYTTAGVDDLDGTWKLVLLVDHDEDHGEINLNGIGGSFLRVSVMEHAFSRTDALTVESHYVVSTGIQRVAAEPKYAVQGMDFTVGYPNGDIAWHEKKYQCRLIDKNNLICKIDFTVGSSQDINRYTSFQGFLRVKEDAQQQN